MPISTSKRNNGRQKATTSCQHAQRGRLLLSSVFRHVSRTCTHTNIHRQTNTDRMADTYDFYGRSTLHKVQWKRAEKMFALPGKSYCFYSSVSLAHTLDMLPCLCRALTSYDFYVLLLFAMLQQRLKWHFAAITTKLGTTLSNSVGMAKALLFLYFYCSIQLLLLLFLWSVDEPLSTTPSPFPLSLSLSHPLSLVVNCSMLSSSTWKKRRTLGTQAEKRNIHVHLIENSLKI